MIDIKSKIELKETCIFTVNDRVGWENQKLRTSLANETFFFKKDEGAKIVSALHLSPKEEIWNPYLFAFVKEGNEVFVLRSENRSETNGVKGHIDIPREYLERDPWVKEFLESLVGTFPPGFMDPSAGNSSRVNSPYGIEFLHRSDHSGTNNVLIPGCLLVVPKEFSF